MHSAFTWGLGIKFTPPCFQAAPWQLSCISSLHTDVLLDFLLRTFVSIVMRSRLCFGTRVLRSHEEIQKGACCYPHASSLMFGRVLHGNHLGLWCSLIDIKLLRSLVSPPLSVRNKPVCQGHSQCLPPILSEP